MNYTDKELEHRQRATEDMLIRIESHQENTAKNVCKLAETLDTIGKELPRLSIIETRLNHLEEFKNSLVKILVAIASAVVLYGFTITFKVH